MSYLTRIDELRRAELFKRARDFAATYKPELPTIVILPGGMGSRLQRCLDAYNPNSSPPIVTFYELWCGIGPILKGELAFLAQDEFTCEMDQHPIVAAGELTNVVKSYDGIFDLFKGLANVIGMGYDWRRAPVKECGYVRAFLQLIAEQVRLRNAAWPDPRRRLTLYAHSQGGLVAKLFVNDLIDSGEDVSDWFERLVTCCTPFYGTNSHFERYYSGESLINGFTGGADAVARIVATFQGTYILLPAPREVLKPRLATLGLARYPVRDMDNDSIECDPFDSDPKIAGRHRPEVSRAHLSTAKAQFALLDRDFPPSVAQRVYNIRSDIYGGEGTSANLEILWRQVNGATYAAGQGSPIRDNPTGLGRGDGTVPFWSARLPCVPDNHVFDVNGVKHGGAAEHPVALAILSNLVQGSPVPPGPHVARFDFAYASPARVAQIGYELRVAQNQSAYLDALPSGEYRAFFDSFCLSA